LALKEAAESGLRLIEPQESRGFGEKLLNYLEMKGAARMKMEKREKQGAKNNRLERLVERRIFSFSEERREAELKTLKKKGWKYILKAGAPSSKSQRRVVVFKRPWFWVASSIFLWLTLAPAAAQTVSASKEGYRLSGPPKVYIETENVPPEIISFSPKPIELPFLELVSSSEEAQVVVSIQAQQGEGKAIYTLRLRGQKELAGEGDELSFEVSANASSDQVRQELLSALKPALMRFVGHSALARRLQIKFLEAVKPTAVADPWNFWVFSLSLSSFLNGEKTYDAKSLYGSFSANRVTPEWKIRLSLSGSWDRSEYSYGDEVIKSSFAAKSFYGLVVRSLSEHWSVGAYFSAGSSTYENTKLSVAPAPAIEYNVFPYSESTRRQLRFLYRLSFTLVGYREETIYFKTKENLWRQALTAALEFKRKWGTVSLSLEGSNYFHDWQQNRLRLSSEVSLRLFKGLSLSVYGNYSRIHDQLSLPRRGATLEEVILRRRQLETAYDYYFRISLNYTFGSILSKIVNPRFGEGGGFSISISM